MTKILVLVPVRPTQHPGLLKVLEEKIDAMVEACRDRIEFAVVYDHFREPKQEADSRPWSKVTRVRNRMVKMYVSLGFTHVLWVDSDVVDFPPTMPLRLLEAGHNAIVAPLVLVEGSERFYDWAAFVMKGRSSHKPEDRWDRDGRQLKHDPPYWDVEPATEIVEMDCVGTIVLLPAMALRMRAVEYTDHPAFTDHYEVSKWAGAAGIPTFCHRGVRAYHADLPKWGEDWH